MPGTAPDRLTFCTLGPAATIVVSCRIGNTVDIFHSRGSTAVITSLMFLVPLSAASMFDWMLRSQMPVNSTALYQRARVGWAARRR